jgi:ribonuclease HI
MNSVRRLIVYTDGASRSNPGHAACAYLVMEDDKRPFKMHAEYLGPSVTNNVAEYRGIDCALAFLIEFTNVPNSPAWGYITIRSDSQLVVEQLNRRWKVRDRELKAIWTECQERLRTLESRGCIVTLEFVRREYNRQADQLCNQALDAALH